MQVLEHMFVNFIPLGLAFLGLTALTTAKGRVITVTELVEPLYNVGKMRLTDTCKRDTIPTAASWLQIPHFSQL